MTALDSQCSEFVEPFTPDDRGDQVKGQGPKRLEMGHKRNGAALCCGAQNLFEAQGQGRSLVQHRNAIEVRAVELLGDLSDYQFLRLALALARSMLAIAEASDLWRLCHHGQFLKFCGIDLVTMQSGLFRSRSKI
jgi:hypothetical protein